MCGSLTLIPQKGNLFVFRVIFSDEKRGEYECFAVAHPLRYCATTNRSVETMHNKSAQLHFKALLAASILSAVRF